MNFIWHPSKIHMARPIQQNYCVMLSNSLSLKMMEYFNSKVADLVGKDDYFITYEEYTEFVRDELHLVKVLHPTISRDTIYYIEHHLWQVWAANNGRISFGHIAEVPGEIVDAASLLCNKDNRTNLTGYLYNKRGCPYVVGGTSVLGVLILAANGTELATIMGLEQLSSWAGGVLAQGGVGFLRRAVKMVLDG